MDARTRLLALDLSQHDNGLFGLSTFMARLGSTLGMAHPPLDIGEVHETLVTAGVESLLVVVACAQNLPATCFLRAEQLLRTACRGTSCRVHWLMDDLSMLERLALPAQATIALNRVMGRPTDDTLLDLLSGLLAHAQVLPSQGFLEELGTRLERGAPAAELRLFMKLSLLEHFVGQARDPSGLLELDSVRQTLAAIPNPSDETIHEIGAALATDAGTALGKLAWAWTVLVTLRSLWGEDVCPAVDLLRQPTRLGLVLPRWCPRMLSASTGPMTDGAPDVRKIQLFQRALIARASDSAATKELLARLPPADLESFLRVTSDFVSSYLDPSGEALWSDFCQLEPGRSTAKLMTPRLMEVLQMALEHPEFYQRGQLHREPQQDCHPPDTALVFRLAGECGKFINTHDWYLSYRQLADPQRTQDEAPLM